MENNEMIIDGYEETIQNLKNLGYTVDSTELPQNIKRISEETANSMEWVVKIEGKPKERLLAKYKPIDGIIEIFGQHKVRNEWTDFSRTECAISDINLESLKKALGDALMKLKKEIENHIDLEKTFKAIGSIAIVVDKKETSG